MTVGEGAIIVGAGAAARDIRYIHDRPSKAGAASLFWLSGFMSDMASTKASALADYARSRGIGYTRFDYSGHGLSGGEFREGTIGRWLEEARAVFSRITQGPQIIIGSSMGGHIALILLRALLREAPDEAARVAGVVLIAPAWDMTEELMWKQFPQSVRNEILQQGFHLRPSAYDAPYTITRELIEDGRRHLLAREPFDPGRPVVILQGLQDADVPAAHTRELLTFLKSDNVQLIEIPDGEHRLSRPADLEMLFKAVASIAER
ncbi:MAG: alpha/beta hydrolase [Hyphomicrobium sp.]